MIYCSILNPVFDKKEIARPFLENVHTKLLVMRMCGKASDFNFTEL